MTEKLVIMFLSSDRIELAYQLNLVYRGKRVEKFPKEEIPKEQQKMTNFLNMIA